MTLEDIKNPSKNKKITEWLTQIDHYATLLLDKIVPENYEERALYREQLLALYLDAGSTAEQSFQSPTEAQQLYQCGLNYAEQFFENGEIDPSLRELVLKLYLNAGTNARQALNAPTEAQQFYHRGLNHAEQFLNRYDEVDSGIREQVLRLYGSMGVLQRKLAANDVELELRYYQQGLKQAQAFLQQGEAQPAIYENILKLYTNILSTWYEKESMATVIQHLPHLGLWTWVSLGKMETGHQENILNNWRLYLEKPPAPVQVTRAFLELLRTLLLVWHDPLKPHRHFVSTETLLALNESLSSLEQAQENFKLKTVYRQLQKLQDSPAVRQVLDLPLQQQALEQKLQSYWEHFGIQPTALDDFASLQKLSWWQKHFSERKRIPQLYEYIQFYRQLPKPSELAKDYNWQCLVEETEKVLFKWLQSAIEKQLGFSQELESLPEIILGILLVNNTRSTAPENLLSTWQQSPPWQNAESLQTAFANSSWKQWVEIQNPSLKLWLELLGYHSTAMRLRIAESQLHLAQPSLQTELHALSEGQAGQLSTRLNEAWEAAQSQATRLARLLAALAEPDYQGDWFAEREVESDIYLKALVTVILGEVPKQVEEAVQNWLSVSEPKSLVEETEEEHSPESPTVLETLHRLKHLFTRIIPVYYSRDFSLENTLQEWAKVRLNEVLSSEEAEQPLKIWNILESTRIHLLANNLTEKWPVNWEETLGKELWSALATHVSLIEKGYTTGDKTQWPLLKIWLDTLEPWLSKPPTVESCQEHLQPQEALAQPFFDPIHCRLRVLWLDKQGLDLRDLPDAGAYQHLWTTDQTKKGGVLDEWGRGLSEWTQPFQNVEDITAITQGSYWQTVLNAAQLKVLANCLIRWAKKPEIEQVTVIFPASLAQLPWETLPTLEKLLVREISITHWLNSATNLMKDNNFSKNHQEVPFWQQNKYFYGVLSDQSSHQAKCLAEEAQWIAKHFNLELPPPNESLFDTLQTFVQTRHVHLAISSHFNPANPPASYLTLDSDKNIKFPLWACTHLPLSTELMVLSANEAILNGSDIQGLLTPEGIGTRLAAAGTKTIIGTLWPTYSFSTLCFNYYLTQIADENPQLPWPQVLAKARQALREMSTSDLSTLVENFNWYDLDDPCRSLVSIYQKNASPSEPIFAHPFFWAGYTVWGKIGRR